MEAEAAKQSSHTSSEMVDIRSIITGWAYKLFDKDRTWKQKWIKKNQLTYDIDWSRVTFHHGAPDYKKVTKADDPTLPPRSTKKVLFKTEFENRTGEEQYYSFKAERTTSTTLEVEVDKGVMTGFETSLTLKVPGDVMEANAGFKREVSVNTINRESEVETLSWGVDSQIKVQGNHRTIAQLSVNEIHDKKTYSIKSYFYGDIKVNIVKKKDLSHVTHVGGDIVTIIEKNASQREKRILKHEKKSDLYPEPVISYETTGSATFRFGAEQKVDLEELPVNSKQSNV